MSFAAGICPKCHKYLLLKENIPFLVCPMCGESISNEEAVRVLANNCRNEKQVDALMADCITLEMQYGPELPFAILSEIVDRFPQLEGPSYLFLKMTGYEISTLRGFLKNFAEIKSQPMNVPWAEEFLDNCLSYRNMEFADLFLTYVENKISKDRQDFYREKINQLRKEYTFKSDNPQSTKWLLTIYIASSILNVLILPLCMLISGLLCDHFRMYFAVNIGISMLIICGEMLLMFIHHKIYGNRLGMSDKERICMVIFMSSIIFAIGSSIMGSIWKFPL